MKQHLASDFFDVLVWKPQAQNHNIIQQLVWEAQRQGTLGLVRSLSRSVRVIPVPSLMDLINFSHFSPLAFHIWKLEHSC